MATLYDPQGNLVDLAALREPLVVPAITGVRSMFTDAVAAKMTPAQLGKVLQGAAEGDSFAYLTLAEEMEERDLHYASVLSTRKRALSALELHVEAASDDAQDQDLADAVRELVANPAMEESVEDLADAFGKGYSACEINWDRTETRWTPCLEHVDPRLFRFDRETGKELRLKSIKEPEGMVLPPYKFIVHRARFKSGLPLRGGLARLVAWSHMFKTFTLRDWGGFLEVYGMPLRIGRYGPNSTPQDMAALRRAVANLGSDAAAVLPEHMQIEFQELTKGATNSDLFERAAAWADTQVSKAVLGQTMTTDSGSSRSQAEVHDNVRMDILAADARAMGRTLNRDLVRPYVDLNFGPRPIYPRLVVRVPKPEDLKAKVEALEKLVPLGLRVSASEVRDKLGFADPGQDEEVLRPAVPQAPQGPPGTPSATKAAANARKALNTPSAGPEEGDGTPDPLDELEALATGQWERIMPALIKPLAQLATDKDLNAMSDQAALEAFRARMADMVATMDTSKLQELVAQCRFMAHGAGVLGASIG